MVFYSITVYFIANKLMDIIFNVYDINGYRYIIHVSYYTCIIQRSANMLINILHLCQKIIINIAFDFNFIKNCR